jgi:hypothetical protein
MYGSTMTTTYRYILRYTIAPEFHEGERLENLLTFCKAAGFEEVMFFISGEELNTGHITIDEATPYIEVIKRAKKRLADEGIITSLNPWATLLHADRGRKLKSGQNFSTMVDPYGGHTKTTACPLCPNFQKYITDLFAYYVAEISPDTIWIEDDFRLHNHSPLEWGGCFCEAHLAAFAKYSGAHVSRAELFSRILALGIPHVYRKAWFELNRQTMVDLAGIISNAVHNANPSTKIGLMSSDPAVHCAEYRDWHGILGRFAPAGSPINRPHLPAYTEDAPGRYLWHFSRITPYTQVLEPSDTILYPEMDCFSHSRFSHSHSFAKLEMLLSLSVGAKGITVNTNMAGNGVYLKENYQHLFATIKPFLSRVVSMKLSPRFQQGVHVLVNEKSSEFIHTTAGKSMVELYPQETFWASLLNCFGIACVFDTDPEQNNNTLAISGQYFRGLSSQAINKLFAHNRILMDAEAAYTLYEMGFAHLAGIKTVIWLKQETGRHTFEQICDSNNYYDISDARISAQMCSGDALKIEYSEPIEVRSILKDMCSNTVCNGMAIFNKRVIILPYSHFPEMPFTQMTPVRQAFIKKCLLDIEPTDGMLTYTLNEPFLPVYRFDLENQTILLIVNGTSDDLEKIEFYMHDLKTDHCVAINSETNIPQKYSLGHNDKPYLLELPVKAMNAVILIFER